MPDLHPRRLPQIFRLVTVSNLSAFSDIESNLTVKPRFAVQLH